MSQESLSSKTHDQPRDVLVIGAGLSGLAVAINIAETGRKVLLIDQALSHGGTLTILDRQFPTDSCGFCQLLPPAPSRAEACLKSAFHHPLIEFLPATELQGVKGRAGHFIVDLRSRATCIDDGRCTRCGKCIEACPVTYPDPLQGGMVERKPIGYRSPLCAPSKMAIDLQYCTRCGACVTACPGKAIQFRDEQQNTYQREVSSIVLATGFSLCSPSLRRELGYGRFPDVVTTLELERLIAKAWTGGTKELRRPSDGQIPSRIAWIQCVGSRDLSHDYCSSICCMISLKEARMVRDLLPNASLKIFYMDMRTCGKGYERYLEEAKAMGIEMVRGRPSEVFLRNGEIHLQSEDHRGALTEEPFDLIVLSTGLEPNQETLRLAAMLDLQMDPAGFIVTQPGTLSKTNKDGIYVAGAASEPRDIPESVIQACEAAALALSHAPKGLRHQDMPLPPTTDPRQEDLRILVILCDCCESLCEGLDFNALAVAVKDEAGVAGVLLESRACREEGKARLKATVDELGANGVVLAACTPRWLRPRGIADHLGIDANLVEIVNLREQGVWSGSGPKESEHSGAVLAQIRAALNRMRFYRPGGQSVPPREPERRILILGGGAAGMAAALAAADMGLEAVLVEREQELGGSWRWLRYGLDPAFLPQKMLEGSRRLLESRNEVRILKGAEVKEIKGRPGHYTAKVSLPEGGLMDINAGAIVVATGARMVEPPGGMLGLQGPLMTQRTLELELSEGRLNPSDLREVVMIQCVGSRDESHPYCSRICCAAALKNSIYLLEANPQLRLFVLYRDLRAFGTLERFYRKAREKGAIFVPFDPDDPPRVVQEQGGLRVVFWDPLVGARVQLRPDRVVLSTGIEPEVPRDLLRRLGARVDEGGFVEELNPKFRPLDLGEGIFAAGSALGPAFLHEAMAQGRAAVLRAVTFLERLASKTRSMGARVYPSRCSSCGLCVEACPVGAREIREDEGYSVVYEELCQACGGCVAVCPNDATQLWGGSDRQTLAAIEALVE